MKRLRNENIFALLLACLASQAACSSVESDDASSDTSWAGGGKADASSATSGVGGVAADSGGLGGGSSGGASPGAGGLGIDGTGANSSGGASENSGGERGESGGSGGGGPEETFTTRREAAAAAGKKIGAAVSASALASDGTFAEILGREFDYVTPENSAKWGPLAPTNASYSWGDTDALVAFAEQNDQAVKGHTFVWHIQTPSWVSETMSAQELRDALKSHIETTLDRYRGKMRAWDVVNEAVDVSTASGYTDSVFYRVLGASYIEDAFRWARAADPDIQLIYNEVGIERMGAKSDFAFEMLRDLLERGVPIDGVGFQAHISTHRYPSESDLRANIRRFGELGLKVNISEVDARTKLMPGDEASRWQAERVAFQQIVGACVVETACEAVTFWGVTDNYSWINDDGPEDPLIYDRSNISKPAYEGVMDGLQGLLPIRGANVLLNADFAGGDSGWSASGGTMLVDAALDQGGNAACVAGRVSPTDGLLQDGLLADLSTGGPMAFSALVRVSSPSTVDVALIIEEGGTSPREFNIATRPLGSNVWTEVSGYLGLGFEAAPTAIALKLFGPDPGVELCVTDVKLQPLSVE
jgi:endo-1,4-beta-xylanase